LRTVTDMFSSQRCKGFTLLEVIIALSIIGIVLVSVFKMQAGNIKIAQKEKFYSIAPLLAAKQLALIETDILNYENADGNFDEEYAGYKWTCEINSMGISAFDDTDSILDQNAMEKFKKIILTITGFENEHSYQVTTWRYIEEE
jgi:general secretion pathway protein I